MKALFSVFIIITVFCKPVNSQTNLLERRISVHCSELTIKEIIHDISNQDKIRFRSLSLWMEEPTKGEWFNMISGRSYELYGRGLVVGSGKKDKISIFYYTFLYNIKKILGKY